jgi:hypothetical protein
MFLVGLNFIASLPIGIALFVLQTGLIGFLGFLGLTQIRVATEPQRQIQVESKTVDRGRSRDGWIATPLNTRFNESIMAGTQGVPFR